MQLLVSHGSLARSRVLHLQCRQLVAAAPGLAVVLLVRSGGMRGPTAAALTP